MSKAQPESAGHTIAPNDSVAEGSVGPAEPSKAELDAQARELEVEGRSRMSKTELSGAVLEAVARRALAGEFGVGQAQRLGLKQAGYNPNQVQQEIRRLRNAK